MSNETSQPEEKPESVKGKKAEKSIADHLGTLFASREDESLLKGLQNLAGVKDFSDSQPVVSGKPYSRGVMGFRRSGRNLNLALACGKAQVRYLDLNKYIAMVENMMENEGATIMLQNFQDQDDIKNAKGQVLGRINPDQSAIFIIQGLAGRIIHGPADIALFDVYYIDRATMTAFYIAAKEQIGTEDELDNMIAAYDGWRAFEVPLDPYNPYGE